MHIEAPTLVRLAAKTPRNLATAAPDKDLSLFGERGGLRGELSPACGADIGE